MNDKLMTAIEKLNGNWPALNRGPFLHVLSNGEYITTRSGANKDTLVCEYREWSIATSTGRKVFRGA